jgi:hypothetical protein
MQKVFISNKIIQQIWKRKYLGFNSGMIKMTSEDKLRKLQYLCS